MRHAMLYGTAAVLAALLSGAARAEDALPAKNVDSRAASMREVGMGWGEIGHTLATAQLSGRELPDVLGLRGAGMGWGEIAAYYGLQLTDVRRGSKLLLQGFAPAPTDSTAEQGRTRRLGIQYGFEYDGVAALREDGMSWGEVSRTLALARLASRPVGEIEKLRDSSLGWSEIAQHYGLKMKDLLKAVEAAAPPGAPAPETPLSVPQVLHETPVPHNVKPVEVP